MSGVETLGIISAIITIIEACCTIYESAKNSSGLPPSFRDSAKRLPLVKQTLSTVRGGLSGEMSLESEKAIILILESCETKAAELKTIFRAATPDGSSSPTRLRRYYRALKATPKSDKVKALMDGIFMDLQLLAANCCVDGVTRAQVNGLLENSTFTSRSGGSARAAEGGPRPQTFYNTGSGTQIVRSGTGDLHVTTGTGQHFIGDIGTLNLNVPFR